MDSGVNNSVEISTPKYNQYFMDLFQSDSNVYFNKLKNYQTPLRLSFVLSCEDEELVVFGLKDLLLQ